MANIESIQGGGDFDLTGSVKVFGIDQRVFHSPDLGVHIISPETSPLAEGGDDGLTTVVLEVADYMSVYGYFQPPEEDKPALGIVETRGSNLGSGRDNRSTRQHASIYQPNKYPGLAIKSSQRRGRSCGVSPIDMMTRFATSAALNNQPSMEEEQEEAPEHVATLSAPAQHALLKAEGCDDISVVTDYAFGSPVSWFIHGAFMPRPENMDDDTTVPMIAAGSSFRQELRKHFSDITQEGIARISPSPLRPFLAGLPEHPFNAVVEMPLEMPETRDDIKGMMRHMTVLGEPHNIPPALRLKGWRAGINRLLREME